MAEQECSPRGLSDADRQEIERLCSVMSKPTPGKIARRLGRDVGTVAWFMIRQGLIERKISYAGPASYVQGGKTVFRYTEAHDLRLVELSRAGKRPREIATIITAQFGIARTAHSVDVRLTMLAAYEGGPEQ